MTENSRGDDEPAEYIAIGVGGTAARKHWPPEYYAALLRRLLQENSGRRFVIVGGPEDQSEAQAIVRMIGDKYAGEFTTELNFRMSAAAIGRCSWYIGNDTSSMHLAAAHGVPVLCPNCYPVSLGLGERAVPVVYAPRNSFFQTASISWQCPRRRGISLLCTSMPGLSAILFHIYM